MPGDISLNTFQIIGRLAHQMLGHSTAMRWQVSFGVVLELAGVVLGILGPYFLKALIDAFSAGRTTNTILLLVGLFVLSWSGASILSTVRAVFSTKVIDQMTGQLASQALRQKLPDSAKMKNADSGGTLGLLERLPYSRTIVVDGLIWRTVPIILQLVGSLWLICALIPIHYAIILALVLAGYVAATWITARHHKRRSVDANMTIGALSKETGDVIRNARRVVFNGALDLEIWRLQDLFHNKTRANNRMMWSLVVMVAWQYGVVGAGLILLLSLGTMDVIQHRMTVGDFVLLQAYALRLAVPLSGIGFVFSQSAVAIANIREVLNLANETGGYGEGGAPGQGPASIELSDVSFSYTSGQPALQNITLDIKPGSFVVIVGPNGSGKSTLAQIMAGILTPDSGEVLIDGRSLAYVHPNERHRYILYVPQFIGMFNRTLEANGLYPPTTSSAVNLAQDLSKWRFHDDGRAPDLNLVMGEQGERLSGGQLQKLELARIANIDAPAIILDESTSALDARIERQIVSEIIRHRRGQSTLIMISHKAEVACLADMVVYMAGGRIEMIEPDGDRVASASV